MLNLFKNDTLVGGLCVCVCVRERERDTVCVCVVEREIVCLCVVEREREREIVCVFRYIFAETHGGISLLLLHQTESLQSGVQVSAPRCWRWLQKVVFGVVCQVSKERLCVLQTPH